MWSLCGTAVRAGCSYSVDTVCVNGWVMGKVIDWPGLLLGGVADDISMRA